MPAILHRCSGRLSAPRRDSAAAIRLQLVDDDEWQSRMHDWRLAETLPARIGGIAEPFLRRRAAIAAPPPYPHHRIRWRSHYDCTARGAD